MAIILRTVAVMPKRENNDHLPQRRFKISFTCGTKEFIETSGILEKEKKKGRKGDWSNIKGLKSKIPHHTDHLKANT
jgi:hypothetical protein